MRSILQAGWMDRPMHPKRCVLLFEPFFQESGYRLQIYALRRSHRPTLLEAFPAKHRPSLRRTEGNRGFLPALRAVRFRFRAHRRGVTAATAALRAFRLATFAALGFVLEPLVGEKHLFAGGKDELSAALRTLQHPIVIFHEPLSLGPAAGKRMGGLCT